MPTAATVLRALWSASFRAHDHLLLLQKPFHLFKVFLPRPQLFPLLCDILTILIQCRRAFTRLTLVRAEGPRLLKEFFAMRRQRLLGTLRLFRRNAALRSGLR